MKKIATILLCLIPLCAAAAQAPVKQDPAEALNNPEKLKVKDCELILAGLKALDGYTYISNKGRPDEKASLINYEFGNAALRETILKNLAMLEPVRKRADENRQRTFDEYAKGESAVPVEKRPEYSIKVREIEDLPCEVVPKHFDIKSLLLGKNEIPGTALQAMDTILDKQ